MVKSRDCPKCGGVMSEGFVADHTHGGFAVSSWVEGPPAKSIWVGVQLTGKPRSEIATWRCRRCGFLESYAVDEPNLGRDAQARSQTRLAVAILLLVTAISLAVVGGILFTR